MRELRERFEKGHQTFQSILTSEGKVGLPNSFFGPDSPMDPDPFANLPKDLLDQTGMKTEEEASKAMPPISPNEPHGAVPQAPKPQLTLADFEAEEALFSR